MDQLISLFHHALDQRNSIWMFYTIIITSAAGIAFTDSYKQLPVIPRLFITFGIGATVWYNFFSIITNTRYLHELSVIIQREATNHVLLNELFTNGKFLSSTDDLFLATYVVYLPLNIALLVALWWDESVFVYKKITKYFNNKD